MKKFYLLFLWRDGIPVDDDYLGYTDNLYFANIYKRYLESIKRGGSIYSNHTVIFKAFDSFDKLSMAMGGIATLSSVYDISDFELTLFIGRFGNFSVYSHLYIQNLWEQGAADQLPYTIYRLHIICDMLDRYINRFIRDGEYVSNLRNVIEMVVRYVELFTIREECALELESGNIPDDLKIVRDAFLQANGLDIVDKTMYQDYFYNVFSEPDWLNAFSCFDWMGVDPI